jgi:hypothetical protein
MLGIMMNSLATLELTSSSTLIGDVEDHDELVNDLSINIGDLRIDLIVDLLLACGSACCPTGVLAHRSQQLLVPRTGTYRLEKLKRGLQTTSDRDGRMGRPVLKEETYR